MSNSDQSLLHAAIQPSHPHPLPTQVMDHNRICCQTLFQLQEKACAEMALKYDVENARSKTGDVGVEEYLNNMVSSI